MIIVVDLFRVGIEHQAFNAALLQAVSSAYPGEKIAFWGDASHIEHVSDLIPSLSIEYCSIAVAPRHASVFGRAWVDCKIVRNVMALASDSQTRIIFTSISLPMLWAIKVFGGAPSHQIGAVLHGGLAELRHVPRFNIFKRLLSLRWSLTHAPAFVTFWVLEQGIYQALQQLIPRFANRFAVFLHPLPPDLVGQDHQPRLRPLSIGLLGLATPQKGLMVFLKLAGALRGRDIIFDLAGRVHKDSRVAAESGLSYLSELPSAEPMPRAEFVARIKRLSYAAFFFEGSHYSLTASGVLLDCIALGIPLVGRRHPQFDIFQAQVGEIGFFCEPGQEQGMIENLVHVDQDSYVSQCEAMRRLRAERTPLVLGERINSLLFLRR